MEMDRTTMTLQRRANLSQSRELQWTHTLFRQRSIAIKGPANQPVGHLAASLSGPEGSEKFFQEFRWATKCLLQTEENLAHKKLLAMLCCSYRPYYCSTANTIKLYGKMFNS